MIEELWNKVCIHIYVKTRTCINYEYFTEVGDVLNKKIYTNGSGKTKNEARLSAILNFVEGLK
jgi:ribosomal protein S12 methylthiotransferase accessory factor YcaO